MKVGPRLIIGFLVVIVFIWTTAFSARRTYSDIHGKVELLSEGIVPGAITMAEMHTTAVIVAHETMNYILHGKKEAEERLQSAMGNLKKFGLTHLKHESHIGKEDQKAAEQLVILINRLTSKVADITNLKKQGLSVDKLLEEKERVYRAVSTLNESLAEHKAVHMAQLTEAEKAVREAYTSGMRLLLVSTVIVTLLGIIVSLLITLSIVKPLDALHKGTEAIGEGNLNYKTGTNAKDEIGQLSRAFDRMAEDLQKTTVSRDYVENIFKSMADTLVIADPDGIIRTVNQKTIDILGYTEDELLGQFISTILEEEKEEEELLFKGTGVADLIRTGEVTGIEKTYLTKDGRKIPVLFSGSAMRGADGKIEGIVCVALDITDRKRVEKEKKDLEARLQQAHKMEAIGTLAGGIAHDFNNLLMAIGGNVSLMLFDMDSSHPFYRFLTSIQEDVTSGAELTGQILGYARKGRYDPKPINLNEWVAKVSDIIVTTRKDTSVHRTLAEDLFAIEADQVQIQQVLMNLFVNAADAMPGGGDLILKTANVTDKNLQEKIYVVKPGNYVRLTVSDTGKGMDKEILDRIFEPFYTTKELGRGTGLGLASAYGIIKGHGGYIDVESEKGRGTTFTVYLPATEKRVEKTVTTPAQIIKGTETVLLVDDEARIIEVGTKELIKLGYTVLEARDGREAVEVYRDNKDKIDLVILDIVMPHMGGGEAFDRMKEINPKVKVLLSSGYSIDSQAKEILKRGCDAFLQKPYSINELSQKIRGVLDKK